MPLLVVQRDRRFGADRQAVAAVVEAVVEREAAHREEVPVARGVVGVADGGVEPGDVGQAPRAAGLDLLAGRSRWPHRQFLQRDVAEACDVGLGRCRAASDGDGSERAFLRMCAGGQQQGKGAGDCTGERGECPGCGRDV